MATANSRFVYLPRDQKEPGIRYATLKADPVNSEKVFCLWKQLNGHGTQARRKRRLLRRNRLIVRLLGGDLSDQIVLKIHTQYSSPRSRFQLVTDGFDCFLPLWYTDSYNRAQLEQFNKSQWIDLIWVPLQSLVRTVVRFIGKSNLFHGDLKNGIAFLYYPNGDFQGVRLHSFLTTGSIRNDLEQLCRIIAVVYGMLHPDYLTNDVSLTAVDGLDGPVFNYIQRLQHCILAARDLDFLVLDYLIEDPLWWTPLERMDFLQNLVQYFFYILCPFDCDFMLSYFDEIPPAELDSIKFPDNAMDATYNYKESATFFKGQGCLIKLMRYAVVHYNQHYRILFGQDMPGFLVPYLYEITIAAVEECIGINLVRYAFDGVLRFLDDGNELLEERVAVLTKFEFRRGFPGFEPEFVDIVDLS